MVAKSGTVDLSASEKAVISESLKLLLASVSRRVNSEADPVILDRLQVRKSEIMALSTKFI